MTFDFVQGSQSFADEKTPDRQIESWRRILREKGLAAKARAAAQKSLKPGDLDALAREVFDQVSRQALQEDVHLGPEDLLELQGILSGLGPLLALIARADVEDIAINLGHLYAYTTARGWEHVGPAPDGIGEGIRVMLDQAGQSGPSPADPIADAMLQVMVPTAEGVRRKGLRVNFIMPPASPYGDTITLRITNYHTLTEGADDNLARLCATRLPAVPRPVFQPRPFPGGEGVMTPEAANYLLAVMVAGGTLVIAGATGCGKTFIASRILQEMLDFFPPGSIRLFIIEDSNEIVLNGWNGDPHVDTRNVVYTVTRPESRGGPRAVTMYDLVRAALRARPHGLVIGEARGAEAWELIRASATGHGHSAFTIHATSADHVWQRFAQVVRANEEARSISDYDLARYFADAVSAVVYVERSPRFGQVVMEIAEVSTVVERTAARPPFTTLFRFDREKQKLLPSGNRPMRPGFRAAELGLPESYFMVRPDG
jgi:type IV secretory pathway ATPase VirB11/archaellum biosynthesis ATPase